MARGSLSLESRLPARLAALNVSLRTFCALSDLKISTLSGILNGKRDFTATERDHIEGMLAEMVALQSEVNRIQQMLLPIDWAHPAVGCVLAVRKTSQLVAARN
jgi:hypothetical protein